MLRKAIVGAVATFCLTITSGVFAQDELPSAEKVIKTYIEKTGGLKTYKSVKNASIKAEMSIPAANLKGKVDILFQAPNKFHFIADMGDLGKQERGSDGKVMWENSTVQGARLIEGDEAEQMLEEISFGTILNPLKFYKSMKTTGKKSVNDEECYVVEFTKKNGDVDTEFYSVKSGLKVKSIKKVESPLGKIAVESYDRDYKKSNNGLLTAWSGEQKIGPNSIMMKMSSVEFNTDVDKSRFEVPEEVKELIEDK